jgi:putative ATP-dependent endonuclease of OLD family
MPKPIHIFAERDVSEETKLKSGTLLNDLLLPVLEEGGVGDSNSIAETRSTLEDSLNDTSQKIAGDLTESMQSHMPDLEAIEVNPGSVSLDKAISPTVKLKDKYLPESVDISERGSGVGSLFILSLMEAYVDMQVGEGYFILFEEPGNSLHPGAERKMLDALKSISEEGGQVTITTHSQVFIDRTDHSQLYIVSRDDGESGFKQVEQDAFEAVDEIGAKNSDILQSDFVFYVEGASDVEVIEEICSQKYDDWESKNVSVQHLGGTGNLTHCDPEKLKKINRNCAFILDSDRDSESDEPNSTAQNLKQESDEVDIPCKILNRSTIENYFTAYGVNQTFGVSAEEGFIGDYDDAVDLIKQEAADRRPDGDPDNVNYNKIKHGREIVELMYENGQRIYEIEEFIDDCL